MPHTLRTTSRSVCAASLPFLRYSITFQRHHFGWNVSYTRRRHSRARHRHTLGRLQFGLSCRIHCRTAFPLAKKDTLVARNDTRSFVRRDALAQTIFRSSPIFHIKLFPLRGGHLRPPCGTHLLRGVGRETSQQTLALPIGNRKVTVQKHLLNTDVLVDRLNPVSLPAISSSYQYPTVRQCHCILSLIPYIPAQSACPAQPCVSRAGWLRP